MNVARKGRYTSIGLATPKGCESGRGEGLLRTVEMGDWSLDGSQVGSSARSFARSNMASLNREKRLGPATAPNGRRVRR